MRRALTRLRRRAARVRANLLRRRGFTLTDRATIVIAAAATATTAGALAVEVRRMWRRTPPAPAAAAHPLIETAEEAVGETVEAVVRGYRAGTPRENAVFNLLVSFLAALGFARGVAYGLRSRRRLGPFRNVRVGRRHIHHFVPGILMAFVSGAAAIVTRDEDVERFLAIPFGAGMGLTFDESALLLELEDVYWSEEGIVGMQIAFGVAALLGALAIGTRFTRRGERILFEPPTAAEALGAGVGG